VFQLEGQGMRDTLRQLRPARSKTSPAIVSLYRPGPMDNIPAFVDCKFGRRPIDYLHPTLEPVLKETYGIIVYQEQVMQIAQILAGYSLGEGRPPAPRYGQEEERRRWISSARASSPAPRNAASAPSKPARSSISWTSSRLWLQQEPRGRLCGGFVPDGLAEGERAGRVLRRLDEPRHVQHGQAGGVLPGRQAPGREHPAPRT
jgi:hypothetical protein